ncbi:MAG: type I methionyl aminopeptidase [Candidatus Hermodarchaeia archaeon]|jgi:methionyl aminopeptidase
MRAPAHNKGFAQVQFVTLKDDEYFDKLKHSGMVVAKCLRMFKDLVDAKTPNLNLLDIESRCVEIISEHDCIPTFKGYRGFPGSVCLSVNKGLVHGIPKDYVLKEGDVVTLDLGAHAECGVIADAAVSAIYGEPKSASHPRMLEYCKGALQKGIEAIEVGKQLGCIGSAIHHHVKSSGFKLIVDYGGHGLDIHKPHTQPFVSNKAKRDEGIRIQPGLAIAIEPMIAIGSNKTKKQADQWTVATKGISCHFEHSVFVKEDGVHVMTDWENL